MSIDEKNEELYWVIWDGFLVTEIDSTLPRYRTIEEAQERVKQLLRDDVSIEEIMIIKGIQLEVSATAVTIVESDVRKFKMKQNETK